MGAIIDHRKLLVFGGVLLAVCLLVLIAIIFDLWDGVYTAQATGERVHSHKLRVTISKIFEYWRIIAAGFLLDCIGCIFDVYLIPFVVVIFGTGLILIEIKSMIEHSRKRKSSAANLEGILRKIIEAGTEKDAREVVKKMGEVLTAHNAEDNHKSVIIN